MRVLASFTNCECVSSFRTVKAMYALAVSVVPEYFFLLVIADSIVLTSAGMIPGSKT